MKLDPHEYVDGFILTCGYYEEEVLDALTSHLRPGDVFWDVGSNLGLHALTVARLRGDVPVYAFEPNPAMAGLITAAASANGVAVCVMPVALDVAGGTARFYLHEGNAGRSSLHNWESDPLLRSIDVTTERGDEVVASLRATVPNVMKLDVEGNEQRVLEGMPGLLRAPALHTVVFEDSLDGGSATKNILREAGFVIVPLTRLEATHHDLGNFVATRAPVASR